MISFIYLTNNFKQIINNNKTATLPRLPANIIDCESKRIEDSHSFANCGVNAPTPVPGSLDPPEPQQEKCCPVDCIVSP